MGDNSGRIMKELKEFTEAMKNVTLKFDSLI